MLLKLIVSTTSETVHKKEDTSKAKWWLVIKTEKDAITTATWIPDLNETVYTFEAVQCLQSTSKYPQTRRCVSRPLPPVRSLPFDNNWSFEKAVGYITNLPLPFPIHTHLKLVKISCGFCLDKGFLFSLLPIPLTAHIPNNWIILQHIHCTLFSYNLLYATSKYPS